MIVSDMDIIIRMDTLLNILKQDAECVFDIHGFRGQWQIDILGGKYYSKHHLKENLTNVIDKVFKDIKDSITVLIEQKPCKWFSVAIRIRTLT